jgi:CheB methylesterase
MANEDSSNSDPPGSVPKGDKFPIVGIGASAGGLKAFKQLFQALPSDLDKGFVLIPHLDPEHRSLMPEILTRVTSMPVMQVNDEPLIERNQVYVIPAQPKHAADGWPPEAGATRGPARTAPIDRRLPEVARGGSNPSCYRDNSVGDWN